jgi:hypothetical protein
MTVYVDDMRAKFGNMVMCHMIADTDEELHAMADRIGVARRWFQKPGTPRRHYDIALSKRALVVAAGGVEITARQAACMTGRRAVEGSLGSPHEAIEWRLNHGQPYARATSAAAQREAETAPSPICKWGARVGIVETPSRT